MTRPRTTDRLCWCPHCGRTFRAAVIDRVKVNQTGLPVLGCFDCLNRRAIERQRRLEGQAPPAPKEELHHDD